MHSLIDELASTGHMRLGAPFLLVPGSSAVTIAGSDKQQRTQHPRVNELSGLPERAVIAVIEADAHPDICALSEFGESAKLIDLSGRGLLHQHMPAAADGGSRDFGLRRRWSRDDDGIDIALIQNRAPIARNPATCARRCHSCGTRGVGIGAADEAGAAEIPCSPLTNDPAADDRDIHGCRLQGNPRSSGTIRRNV
jgi:hypothetical protein